MPVVRVATARAEDHHHRHHGGQASWTGPHRSSVGQRRQTDVVEALLRDVLEVAIVVAVGAMVVTVVRRLVAGDLRVYRCSRCARPTSRAYPRCRHCDREQPDAV